MSRPTILTAPLHAAPRRPNVNDCWNVVTGARYHGCADDLACPGDDPAQEACSDDFELTHVIDRVGCICESDSHGLGNALPGNSPLFFPKAVSCAGSLQW